MGAYQWNALAYTLINSVIIGGNGIYRSISLDKLKEYIVYNIKPFETINIDINSPVPMLRLIGGSHEYDYALWDDDSNRIIYASYDNHNISDVIRKNENSNSEMVRIEITPKGILKFNEALNYVEKTRFHKELINCSGAFVEDYMPDDDEITLSMYSLDSYASSIEDFENDLSEKITSYNSGFVSVPTSQYTNGIRINVRLVENNGKKYFRIIETGQDEVRIPYEFGMTVYQVYYNLLAEKKFFINRKSQK